MLGATDAFSFLLILLFGGAARGCSLPTSIGNGVTLPCDGVVPPPNIARRSWWPRSSPPWTFTPDADFFTLTLGPFP
jgi:hypothetical protein